MVLVNLEDLWLEARPHNVPGTHLERPNWRRKMAHCLDEIRQMPGPSRLLRELTELRGAED
jgi:4-alpha-glucanotransferase